MSKLYTNIQQVQKAKLDYHISMLFAYMAGGEGWGLEVLKCFIRGVRFLLALCVCVCVCVCVSFGGEGAQGQFLSFREKIIDPTPIDK